MHHSDDLIPGDPPVPDDLDESFGPDEEEVLGIDKSVESLRSRLEQSPFTGSALTHMNLGLFLYRRYDLLRDPTSLQEAVAEFREAVSSSGRPDNGWANAYLATCLVRRYEDLGDTNSLVDAIPIFRDSLESLKILDDQTRIWWVRTNLANALHFSYLLNRQRVHLDEAIQLYQSTLDGVEKAQAPKISLHLSYCMVDAYDDFGDLRRLTAASDFLQRSLSEAQDSLRVPILVQFGHVSLRRYESQGDPACLDRAIGAYETALNARARIDYATVLFNLGNALRARHIRSQEVSDLDRAISILQMAVDATPRSSSASYRRTASLCNSLIQRYRHASQPEERDIELAIDLLRNAATRSPVDNPERSRLLGILGEALLAHNQVNSSHLHWQEAVAALRQAASTTAPSSEHRPQVLANLANALNKLSNTPGTQSEVIQCLAEALLMTSANDPSYASIADTFNKMPKQVGFEGPLRKLLSGSRRSNQPQKVLVAIRPSSNESAAEFSRRTLLLQQYLRALDPDCVEAVLDREPLPGAMAMTVPEAGELVVYIEPAAEKLSALAAVLNTWASRHHSQLIIRLPLPDGEAEFEVTPPSEEKKAKPSDATVIAERS